MGKRNEQATAEPQTTAETSSLEEEIARLEVQIAERGREVGDLDGRAAELVLRDPDVAIELDLKAEAGRRTVARLRQALADLKGKRAAAELATEDARIDGAAQEACAVAERVAEALSQRLGPFLNAWNALARLPGEGGDAFNGYFVKPGHAVIAHAVRLLQDGSGFLRLAGQADLEELAGVVLHGLEAYRQRVARGADALKLQLRDPKAELQQEACLAAVELRKYLDKE